MRIEFGFGVGFDRDNQPLDPEFVRLACKSILVRACQVFGGCNLLKGQGAWIDGTGTLVLEESRVLVVDISGKGTEQGRFGQLKTAEMAEFIRAALNQAAVHVTTLVASSNDAQVGGLPLPVR